MRSAEQSCHAGRDELADARADLATAIGADGIGTILSKLIMKYDGEAPFDAVGEAACRVLQSRGWVEVGYDGGEAFVTVLDEGRKEFARGKENR